MAPSPPSQEVRLLLVDPHPFFCEALQAALAEDPAVRVVGWTGDEGRARRMAAQLTPDVVLTEVALAPGSGLNLARGLADKTRVVILTRRDEGDVLLDTVTAGAFGCLGHDTALPELVSFVRGVAAGRFAIRHERLGYILQRAVTARSDSSLLERLSKREREVLGLLVRGMGNGDIASELGVSAETVRTHVGRILRKLRVHSRADAARKALLAGEADSAVDVLRIRGPELAAP